MNGPRVKLIAAVARNRVIGRDNALPWHLPEDLQRFRRLTLDKAVLMGRRTFEAIGAALPRRENIVISRQAGFTAPGARCVGSLEQALACVPSDADAMIIGGGEIYAQALPRACCMHLTLVDVTVEGDALFPEYDAAQWQEVFREEHAAAPGPGTGRPGYAFVDLRRRARAPAARGTVRVAAVPER
jgi:dihydrofolate reductase